MPSTISAGTTAGTAIAVAGDTTGNLAFQTNGTTTAMTIDTSQRVGVGTATPSQKLTVVGNLKSAGAQASNVANLILTRLDNSWSINNETDLRVYVGTGDTDSPSTKVAEFNTNGLFRFNSGYGSAAIAYGCRSWIRLNMATATINGSGNVSSVTDNGTGQFTINFSTAMPDSNYAAVSGATDNINTGTDMTNAYADGTGSYRLIGHYTGNDTNRDVTRACAAVFR
jgi:hypothetical protein